MLLFTRDSVFSPNGAGKNNICFCIDILANVLSSVVNPMFILQSTLMYMYMYEKREKHVGVILLLLLIVTLTLRPFRYLRYLIWNWHHQKGWFPPSVVVESTQSESKSKSKSQTSESESKTESSTSWVRVQDRVLVIRVRVPSPYVKSYHTILCMWKRII